jgi:hypothetical protein
MSKKTKWVNWNHGEHPDLLRVPENADLKC